MEAGKMPRHVVVTLNKGWGEQPETVLLAPRENERLADWNVSEEPNRTMVQVEAQFRDSSVPGLRTVSEYFNSFRIDRVHVEGEDEP